jgi:hypothetical protein
MTDVEADLQVRLNGGLVYCRIDHDYRYATAIDEHRERLAIADAD